MADLQWVTLGTPWTWRVLGGSHKVSARFTTATGERLVAEIGEVAAGLDASRWLLIALMFLGVAAVGGATVMFGRTRRTPAPPPRLDAILATAHNLIRRGASPERAVEELTRGNPDAAGLLVDMDEGLLSDPRFPYLRTRPGRKRMQEIREILKQRRGGDHSSVGVPEGLARVLAEAVMSGASPVDTAQKLNALTTSEERVAFAALDLEQLAQALRAIAPTHPALGTPRARGAVVAIQDALRSEERRSTGVSVGWLVRAGGPGRRGETLKLGSERTIIGSGSGCEIQISGDPAIAPAHAAISAENGEYTLESIGGPVKVEGEIVESPKTLVDGETIELGTGLYVFKAASVLNLASARSMGRSAGRS